MPIAKCSLPSSSSRNLFSSNTGSVMMVVSLLLVSFLAVAALALDITRAAASAEQANANARYGVLRALQSYFETEGTHSQRMDAALTESRKVTKLNLTMLSGDSAKDLDTSGGLLLEAGKYYFTIPPNLDTCLVPCSEAGQVPPCFVPLADVKDECTYPDSDGDNSNDVEANAFRIRGALYSPAESFFMRVASHEANVPMNVRATGAVVPREIVFVADISPSMTSLTHLKTTPASNYSFLLPDDNGGSGSLSHQQVWQAMDATRKADDPILPTKHYQSDYQEVVPYKDSDFTAAMAPYHYDPTEDTIYSGTRLDGKYRIDTFRGIGYRGPEPLSTVFIEGIKTATQEFRDRSVAGDKLGLVLYDSGLSWQRIVKLTADFDYIEKLVAIDVLGKSDEGLDLANKHLFFPGAGTYTNTLSAIQEAVVQFQNAQDGSIFKQLSIVHFGDYLPNCTTCTAPLLAYDVNGDRRVNNDDRIALVNCVNSNSGCGTVALIWDMNGDAVRNASDITAWDTGTAQSGSQNFLNCTPYGCYNTYDHYRKAADEMQTYALNQLYPAHIPVHMVLIGEHVAPHWLETPDSADPTKCISDTVARQTEKDFVSGSGCGSDLNCIRTKYNTMSSALPFYEANVAAYKIARTTAGLWVPILQTSASTPTGCQAGRRRTTSVESMQVQMENAMKTIIGATPYALVDG